MWQLDFSDYSWKSDICEILTDWMHNGGYEWEKVEKTKFKPAYWRWVKRNEDLDVLQKVRG